MLENPKEIIAKKRNILENVLNNQYAHLNISNITLLGNGLEQMVFKALSPSLNEIVIKVPWVRFIYNENDGELDSRKILSQEYMLTKHIEKYSSVSSPIHLHNGSNIDFLISKFIQDDGSEVSPFEKGRFLSGIHKIPFNSQVELIEQKNKPFIEHISERLIKRKNAMEKASGLKFILPSTKEIIELLAERKEHVSLLHMDYRNENLLKKEGKINALIDWSNTLLGDPALEIFRTSEFDGIDLEFLEGYGDINFVNKVSSPIEYIYRLDAAIMLTNVFLTSQPNEGNARIWLNRVEELHTKLLKELQ